MSEVEAPQVPVDRPIMSTLFGDAGVGKTNLASTWPKPVFLRAEDGMQAIPKDRRPPAFKTVTTVDEIMSQMKWLITEKHDFKSCVFDTISKLDTIMINELRRKEGKDNIAQCGGGYGGGYDIIAGQHQMIRRGAEAMMERRGMHVVFLAHADVDTLRIPDADDYMRWNIRVGHKKSLPPYVEDVDLVGFITLEKFVKGEDGRVKRAYSSGDRELICHATASNVSKNRCHITESIPLPWDQVSQGVNPLLKYIPALGG